MAERIIVLIPQEQGNRGSIIKIPVPLDQIEAEIKAKPYDPESMLYLLTLCGVVREAHELKLPMKIIKADTKTLLEEAGYLPKRAA